MVTAWLASMANTRQVKSRRTSIVSQSLGRHSVVVAILFGVQKEATKCSLPCNEFKLAASTIFAVH